MWSCETLNFARPFSVEIRDRVPVLHERPYLLPADLLGGKVAKDACFGAKARESLVRSRPDVQTDLKELEGVAGCHSVGLREATDSVVVRVVIRNAAARREPDLPPDCERVVDRAVG